MENNSPERLDKSLTRLETAHQLSEMAERILADADKLVVYLASVDANGDGIVDGAVVIALQRAGKIRKHAHRIRYGLANALDNADAHEKNDERKRRFLDNIINSSVGE